MHANLSRKFNELVYYCIEYDHACCQNMINHFRVLVNVVIILIRSRHELNAQDRNKLVLFRICFTDRRMWEAMGA